MSTVVDVRPERAARAFRQPNGRGRAVAALLAGAATALALAVVSTGTLYVHSASAAPAAGSASAVDFAAVDNYVRGQLADAHIPGAALAVVHGDQVVHLQGFGAADRTGRPVTPQTPFVLGSVSKSATALAVMQLVEAGQVDLDAPVQRYLPWFRVADPAASAQLTARHFLTQTSGLPTRAGTDPLRGPVTSLEAQVRALARVSLDSPPGTKYTYSNANYEVLGLLVQEVSGEPYDTYVQRHVYAPLAMTHTYTGDVAATADGLAAAHVLLLGLPRERRPFFRPDFVPAGWQISSAEDMGHYLVAEMNGGRYGDANVLSPAGVATMHRSAAPTGLPGQTYAMGWFVTTTNGVPLIAHSGSSFDMHADAMIVPQDPTLVGQVGEHGEWGVVLLGNGTSPLYELVGKQDLIAAGVASLLVGRPPAGTLVGLYSALDALIAVITVLQVRSLVRAVRALRTYRGTVEAAPRESAGWRRLLRRLAAVRTWYLQLLVPVSILWEAPRLLDGPWLALVRTDIGLWLFVFALLQLALGALHLARTPRVRRVARGLAPR
jgi:CubicO group peptidase (beta-lactamase class C family)